MFIRSLALTNFRNIEKAKLEFTKNVNIFYGNNAQGKTNLVEAVSFLSMMKSFREEEDKILIHYNYDFAKIQAEFISNKILHQVEVILERKGKHIHFDGEKDIPTREFIGSVNVVTFSPGDVALFKESPKERRDFLDDELSKLSPSYQYTKLRFNQLLKERNEYLKVETKDSVYFQVITEQFAQVNTELMNRRSEFVRTINRYLSKKYQTLSEQPTASLEIEYNTFLQGDTFLYDDVYQRILDNKEEDERRQASQVGIHRDDFVVYLQQLDVAKFGSQGQMRLSAIALKLALIEVIKEKNQDDAIIVLDDVLSELDTTRQQALISYLNQQNQILLTTAHVEEIKANLKTYACDYWVVAAGEVHKEESTDGK